MKYLIYFWYWLDYKLTGRNHMGVRENKVEAYLDAEVKKLGGITRKWVSPGVSGVPDRIVIIDSLVVFVEVKTVDGVLSPWQVREIKRLKDHGAHVYVARGIMGVDDFIKGLEVILNQ